MAPPLLIGLTGGIAAGKSQALAAFERFGAATFSTDAAVHELLATGPVRDLLVARWGEEVAPGGEVDRARVGAIVFDRAEELAWLESTLHPLVAERVLRWRDGLGERAALAVVEVPLLFEAGLAGMFDATVAIVADDDLRANRAGARGTDLLEARSRRQLAQDEKAARATYVIRNDGTLGDLEEAVARLYHGLSGGGAEARP